VAHAINPSLFGTYPQRPSQHLYWSLLGNYGFRKADHLIAVSGYVRDFCVDTLGIPNERITIIPNGIDPLFRVLEPAAHDPEWGTLRGRPFALVVGNVLAVKNQVTAVQAFAQLANRFPRHHLLLAGGTRDPYADRVRAAIRSAGLGERVHLLGYVEPERLVRLYNAAEVLLMPSLTEGCPVALLEALACGVPVIGSRRGGIPEVVGDAARLIDDPLDVPAWAAALEALLWRGPERQALRDEALRRRRLYSWERTAAETLALYNRLDRARPGGLAVPDAVALHA
jgi:glycosyltransferase involved in cell wall biosynthesis